MKGLFKEKTKKVQATTWRRRSSWTWYIWTLWWPPNQTVSNTDWTAPMAYFTGLFWYCCSCHVTFKVQSSTQEGTPWQSQKDCWISVVPTWWCNLIQNWGAWLLHPWKTKNMIGPEVSTLEPVSRSHMTFPKPLGKHVQTTHYVGCQPTPWSWNWKSCHCSFALPKPNTNWCIAPKDSLQLKLQPMDLNWLLQGQQLTRSLTFAQPLRYLGSSPSETRVTCLGTTESVVTSSTIPNYTISKRQSFWHPIIESGKQLQLNTSHSIGKMAKATLLTSSANIGSLQLCGPCSSLSCSGGARLPPQLKGSDRIPSTTPGAEPPRDAQGFWFS